ncbi:replication initiator protein A, partial [Fusobacterium sp.]|uniref:replication initiator protein A n=3 Tax=Fusobacterium sp. TaxID=68766 RepID=UPI00261EC9E5
MNKKYEVFDVPKNEVIDTGPSEIVEKFLDVSEVENEKQHSLVRIDINVIEYPLFTKNPRRKKNQIIRYFFNRDKEAYIQVNPTSGDFIPGEFEERVFIAILKIMRDKKYNNEFYTKPSEILYNMGIPQTSYKSFYKKITLALQRLSQTSYTFKNSLYSNKMKGIIDDKINTNIMNIRIITLNQAEKDEMEYFQDKRTKEVIKISISNYFYDNIIRKGYLVYDSQLLLNMDSPITRALYMLVNKLRFNKFHLRVLALSLIKKIPLSDDAKSLGRSIKSLEKSCKQLKDMDLISDYNVIKQGKLIQTEIEFFFEEKHNAIKQSFFYDDKNHFDNLLITYTEKGEEGEVITESQEALKEIQQEKENITPTDEKINQIFDKLPARAKELKTMPGAIKDAIRQYGFEYVMYTAEYMSKNKVTKIRSYFIQALEKGWAENFMTTEKSKS